MNTPDLVNFPEFSKIPALCAKRNALHKALEAESEIVQVAFLQNQNTACVILDRLGAALNERLECCKLIARLEKLRWYEAPVTCIIAGIIVGILSFISREFLAPGLVFLLFGITLQFRNLFDRNHLSRKRDDSFCAYDALQFRWQSIGNYSTIYFNILYDEEQRLNALRPIPDREEFLKVWTYRANEWLNAERNILHMLTQRHPPFDRDWMNELDESRENYFKTIK